MAKQGYGWGFSGRKRKREKSPGKGYPILSPTKVYRFTPIGHVDDSVSTRDSIARIRCFFAPRRVSVILSTERKNRYRSHSREREAVSRTSLASERRWHLCGNIDNQISNRYLKWTSLSYFGRVSREYLLQIILQRIQLCVKKKPFYKFVYLCDDCTCIRCIFSSVYY